MTLEVAARLEFAARAVEGAAAVIFGQRRGTLGRDTIIDGMLRKSMCGLGKCDDAHPW